MMDIVRGYLSLSNGTGSQSAAANSDKVKMLALSIRNSTELVEV